MFNLWRKNVLNVKKIVLRNNEFLYIYIKVSSTSMKKFTYIFIRLDQNVAHSRLPLLQIYTNMFQLQQEIDL